MPALRFPQTVLAAALLPLLCAPLGPLAAASADQSLRLAQAATPAQPGAAPAAPGAKSAGPGRDSPQRAEARIKRLHADLHITAAQEPQWAAFAQAMRQNAREMRALYEKRAQSRDTMNAVEDLRSYQQLAQAHADSVKNLLPSFEALYNGMSDSQKKTADALFARSRHAARHGMRGTAKPPAVQPQK